MMGLINLMFGRRAVNCDRLQLDIVARLKDRGYVCCMEEGHINVTRNDRLWSVYMDDTSNPYIKKVIFQDCFHLSETPEEVDVLGSSLLMEVANNQYAAKVRGHQGNYAATYETAVAGVDDFMAEFSVAWDALMAPIKYMANNWDEIVRRFPAQQAEAENKIGFR